MNPASPSRSAPPPSGLTWWRLAAAGFGLLIVLAIATSQAWQPMPAPEPLTPPFTVPSIASTLPTTEQVSSAYERELTPALNRPPTSPLFTSNSKVAADLRRLLYEQAWEVAWFESEGAGYVQIRALVVNRHRDTTPLIQCEPETAVPITGTVTAGVVSAGEWATKACATVHVGRTFMDITVGTQDEEHGERAIGTVTAIVDHVVPQLTDSPDVPGVYRYELARSQALFADLLGVLALGALAVLPKLLDRSRWAYLFERWLGSEPNRGLGDSIDVSPDRHRQSARGMALGLGRFALVLWTLRLTEEFSHLIPNSFVQVGLLALAYIAGILLERWLTTRASAAPTPTRMVTGAAVVPVAFGILMTMLMLTGAGTLWTFGTTMSGFAAGTADLADWQVENFGRLGQAAAVIVFSWSLAPMALGRRVAMLMMRNKPPAAGTPTLLLRTFADDRIRVATRRQDSAGLIDQLALRRKERFEEVIASSLSRYGPPLTVGEPGQVLPPGLGARRMTFSDETWQTNVTAMANQATLIAVTLGRTSGLGWEMQLILEEGLLHKTLFIVPPVPGAERQRRLTLFADAYHVPVESLDVPGHPVLAMAWPLAASSPVVVTSDSADGLSYDLAITRCAEALLVEPDATAEANPGTGGPVFPAFNAAVMEQTSRHDPRAGRAARRGMSIWALNGVFTAIVAPIVLSLLNGTPFGLKDVFTPIAMPEGIIASVALGGNADTGYLLVNDQFVAKGNFEDYSLELVGDLGFQTQVLQRAGDRLYFVSWRERPDGPATVGDFSLTDGTTRWTTPLPEESFSIALDSSRVYAVQARARELVVLQRDTGEVDTRVALPCLPWGISANQETVWITCPNEGRLLEIDSGSLGIRSEHSVPVGAREVVEWGGNPWVHVPVESMIVSVLTPEESLYTPQYLPKLAASGPMLAAEGVDRISAFTANGVIRRNTYRGVTSIAITDDGRIQYTTDSSWNLIRR